MLINRLMVPAAVTGVAVTIGFLIDVNPQAALALVLIAGAAAALGAPAARWLGAAVVATLSFRVFVSFGVLPSTATFVDMFLVWGALAAALVRRRRLPSRAVWPLRFLVGLTVCALASAAMNTTELLRPFVYILLLGTPFAVVLALVIDPPTTRDRRLLGRVLLADAKQVVLALPAMVIAGNWRGKRDVAFRVSAVAVAVVALLTVVPAGATARKFIDRSRGGQGGKEAAAATVLGSLKNDPSTLALGLGPAESVSRAAFMTTPLLLRENSPLHALGLSPATLAAEAQADAFDASGGGTSFDTGISSALGVVGDLGIAGGLIYASMIGYLFVALRRSQRREAVPATCALALFAVLGLVYDWWEQPPFGIVVGLLVGLAIAQPSEPEDPTTPRSARMIAGRTGATG
jgi:hypothetical protein